MSKEDIFLEWLATYGEGKDEMKAGMWDAKLVMEFAEYYHNSIKILELDSKDRGVVIIGTDHIGNEYEVIKRVAKNHNVLVVGYTGTTTVTENITKDLSLIIKDRPNLGDIYYPTIEDLNSLPQKEKHWKKRKFHN